MKLNTFLIIPVYLTLLACEENNTYVEPPPLKVTVARRTDSMEKALMLGKTEGKRRRGAMEDEMIGWHH